MSIIQRDDYVFAANDVKINTRLLDANNNLEAQSGIIPTLGGNTFYYIFLGNIRYLTKPKRKCDGIFYIKYDNTTHYAYGGIATPASDDYS